MEKRGVQVTLDELIALRTDAHSLLWRKPNFSKAHSSGSKNSKEQGRGIHFAENRLYQAGDDIRHIDWHATLRTDQTYTKIFHEEKERPIWLLVDHNPSMHFGTRQAFKSVIAARASALCAWAFSSQGERVGGLVFSGEKQRSVPPKGSVHAVLPLLKHLADSSAEPPPAQTDPRSLEQAFNFLLQRQLRGSLIIIFSDFWQWHSGLRARLQSLTRKNTCIGVLIQDPLEKYLPEGGYYSVSDGQHSYKLDAYDLDFKRRYQQYSEDRQIALQQAFRQLNVSTIPLWTTDALLTQLKTLFV